MRRAGDRRCEGAVLSGTAPNPLGEARAGLSN